MAEFVASKKLVNMYNEGMSKQVGADKNAPAHTPGPFVSYPDIQEHDLQFGIVLRSYKFRVKLSPNTGYITFTPTFTDVGSLIISSVRKSEEMVCCLPPHYFSLHAQMERENRLGTEQEEPGPEVCVLYFNLKEQPKDTYLMMKCAVNVICACKQDAWKNAVVSKENYIDCGTQPMTLMCSATPLILCKHQHDYNAFGLQQEYFLNISVFDFSKASVVPYEVQQLIAEKHCSMQLRHMVGKECGKPFDVTIKCKGGYSIGAHRIILSIRCPFFKSMLDSDVKEGKHKTIHFMDLNAPAMKIIVHFIYTGQLIREWVNVPVEELLYAADKYELPELLSFFDHLMILGCNFGNAFKLEQLADRYSLKNAKISISNFIEN